jgi:hypothetical protein
MRVPVALALGCLLTAPLAAQEQQQAEQQFSPPAVAQSQERAAPTGPRLLPHYQSYQPTVTQQEHDLAAAAAADRTVITISTLGLVLLIVLLVLLIA